MTDRIDFEARLESRLRARAALAVRPFEAAAIGRQATAPAPGADGLALQWRSLPRQLRWSIVAIALASSMLGALALGSPLLERTPRPVVVTNGWIAFAVKGFERISDSDIWVVRPGVPDKRLIGFAGDEERQLCPSFSPDGMLLAWTRTPLGLGEHAGDVVVARFDASTGEVGEHRVLAAELGAGCPKWSPDGQRMAAEIHGHVRIIGLDGTSRKIVPSPETGESAMFDWSADGTEIVVVVDNTIIAVPVQGGEPRVIHEEASDVKLHNPTWLPDGVRIGVDAVRHVPIGDGVRIDGLPPRLIAADGSTAPIVLPDASTEGVVWSPDGRLLAYHRTTLDSRGLTSREVVVSAVEGGDPRVMFRSMAFIRGLTWSPDGTQVLYIVDGLGRTEPGSGLMTVLASGEGVPTALSAPHMFYNGTSNDLSWQPAFNLPVGP